MELDSKKLAEVMVAANIEEEEAKTIAKDLYETTEKVVFRAILWGYAKFGDRATYDVDLITRVMDNRLNPFQAMAKIVHAQLA